MGEFAKQITVSLDEPHARKLAELAAERQVGEEELASELLAAALDELAGMDSLPDAEPPPPPPGVGIPETRGGGQGKP
jgi:hypothetical protein